MSGGGRLSLQGALNRQNVFDDVPTAAGTHSASLARLERELKEMKDENGHLRQQLEETRSTLEMLVKQKSHESFDERRVNFLKCQLIQQERQILLLNEALGSRSTTLMEVENALSWLADRFRSYITEEIKNPSIPVPRADLTNMVETAESARIKLFKNVENLSRENLSKPFLFMNDFIRPDRQEDCTLFDIASGRLEHLNLKHVSQLESKLSSLYKELVRLHSLMSTDKKKSSRLFSTHMSAAVRERLNTQLLTSCAMMKGCSDDLLTLSLLFPSAPWPALKRPVVKEVTVDYFMSCLPSLPRSKSQDVQRLIQSLIKVCNYRHHMMEKEVRALREEVKFHQSVYDLQIEYTNSLLEAVREGYTEFEKSASEVIVKPLAAVLSAYLTLKATAGEEALRDFLSVFKDNEQQFSEAVDKLSLDLDTGREEKSAAFTAFGEELMQMLDSVVYEQQKKRDRATKERQDLKLEQERLDEELQTLLKDMEFEKNENARTEKEKVCEEDKNSSVSESKPRKSELKTGMRRSQSDLNIERDDRTDSSPEKDDTSENEKNNRTQGICEPKSGRKTPSRSSSVSRAMYSKPPAHLNSGSTVVKPSYKPNLYVPNRTLRLRRAGSLTQLNTSSGSPLAPTKQKTESDISQDGEEKEKKTSDNQEKPPNRRKSDIPKMSRLPARKAPFK